MAAGAVAQIIELFSNGGRVIRFTVDNATAVPKGTLMCVTDARTAAKQTTTTDAFCGVASAEKVANDGSTTLGLYTSGLFLLTSGAAFTAGEKVTCGAEENKVIKIDNTGDLKGLVGVAYETTGGDAETACVYVGGGF